MIILLAFSPLAADDDDEDAAARKIRSTLLLECLQSVELIVSRITNHEWRIKMSRPCETLKKMIFVPFKING
jgi:hypothetical protein